MLRRTAQFEDERRDGRPRPYVRGTGRHSDQIRGRYGPGGDYATWKRHLDDDAAALRKQAGEGAFEVLRSTGDPNLVVHSARWSSVAAARSFFESAEVQAIRERTGVEAPTFLYLTLEDSGP